MSNLKPLQAIYRFIYTLIDRWCSHRRKKRSEHHLSKLDDYLLQDIGMKRVGDVIVTIAEAEAMERKAEVVKDFRTRRVRHPYLIRRRQE